MDAHQLRGLLEERCSTPYGPFVIVHWPPQWWGVMRAAWLDEAAFCHHLLNETPERCRDWLLTTATSPEALMSIRGAALQLVAALLQEAARKDIKQSALLLAARREALDALWSLVDETGPEQPHVRALIPPSRQPTRYSEKKA